jgi:hypothetical protein
MGMYDVHFISDDSWQINGSSIWLRSEMQSMRVRRFLEEQ